MQETAISQLQEGSHYRPLSLRKLNLRPANIEDNKVVIVMLLFFFYNVKIREVL
jgi:hypothetical protein